MTSKAAMLEMVLELQNPHWSKGAYEGLLKRAELVSLQKKLQLKEIQVLLGIRRSGKSTLFKLLINMLLEQHDPHTILYLNLDDPVFSEVWKSAKNLYTVIETAEKLTGVKTKYLFLDEIQNVEMWEKFTKSVYDSEIFNKIFITGSNSSLLKSDYATLLSGRYLTNYVMPLSFREILSIEGINSSLQLVKEKAKVLGLVDSLLYQGAFPEVWKTQDIDLKREQLISYYETILLKDCIANHKIRETKKFQELAHYLLNNNAALFSYNNLAEVIGSNENTVKEFVRILENSFMLTEVKQFSYSLKKQTKTKKKAYCIDNGLIYAVSLGYSENRGRLLESLVYNEIRKMGDKNITFFSENQECDFIVKTGKQLIAIQVTFEITDSNNEREIKGLKQAMQQLSISKAYIVTYNSAEQIIDEKITIVPFWKLFFNETLSM